MVHECGFKSIRNPSTAWKEILRHPYLRLTNGGVQWKAKMTSLKSVFECSHRILGNKTRKAYFSSPFFLAKFSLSFVGTNIVLHFFLFLLTLFISTFLNTKLNTPLLKHKKFTSSLFSPRKSCPPPFDQLLLKFFYYSFAILE